MAIPALERLHPAYRAFAVDFGLAVDRTLGCTTGLMGVSWPRPVACSTTAMDLSIFVRGEVFVRLGAVFAAGFFTDLLVGFLAGFAAGFLGMRDPCMIRASARKKNRFA
jgi:hypothetical protein